MNHPCLYRRRIPPCAVVFTLLFATLCARERGFCAEPRGDRKVASIRLLEVPGTATGSDAKAVLAADDGLYIAGDTWTKESGSDLWLWRVDRAGVKLWEKRLPRRAKVHESCEIVGFLPRRGGGVRVVVVRLGDAAFIDVGRDGEIVSDRVLSKLDEPHGLLAMADDDVLLFGSSTTDGAEDGVAWVARCDHSGAIRWKKTFNPGKDDLLLAATGITDGSLVLVGQTGEYNKFGQGPSRLWLLRIDRDNGRKLGERFIDNARIFPTGRDLIAPCADGVLVPFSHSQLPPICRVPMEKPLSSDARLAHLDVALHRVWEKPAPPTTIPGDTKIKALPPLISLVADTDGLLIRCIDAEANELWRARVTSESLIFPVGTLRLGEKIIVVCNYESHAAAGKKEGKYVMLVTVKLPRQSPK